MPDTQSLPKLVITRFSFLGNSGWKIPLEGRETILFDRARLEMRLWLFERITLASLVAQSDQGFHHYILTSDLLPDWALQHLTAICHQAYPEGRFTIDCQPLGNARKYLRQFMVGRRLGDLVVQIVLDDDDGLANDFIETVTRLLYEADLAAERLPVFISFSRGYGLVLVEDGPPQVYLHRYPFINLGLTMVAAPHAPNILAIDHLAAPRKAGCVAISDPPMFVRSVHGFNDSRVAQTERWKLVPGGHGDAALQPRFPWLSRLIGPA